MNPYVHFVSEFVRIGREAGKVPLGGATPLPRPRKRRGAPVAILFSPHPDDESIVGGLALRLMREGGWNVLNVAVTLGSRRDRRKERLRELRGACEFLGFGLAQTGPAGLEKVNEETRGEDPKLWGKNVAVIAGLLRKHKPRAIFYPHRLDWHGTHVGTHRLVMDALAGCGGLDFYLVETEFWGPMAAPNLMVGYSVKDVADLVAATSFHRGEVGRNPYHLRLPAWMQDNVRRGAELVWGQGHATPKFDFAQLFHVSRWNRGRREECWEGGRSLAATTKADLIFTR